MAATPDTQTDSIDTQLPTPHWTVQWPTLSEDHDPEYLAENDPAETSQQTLACVGISPADPDPRPWVPVDDRDHTRQTSVFEYPVEWWDDADRLEALFAEHDAVAPIADLFGPDRCFETVRSRLEAFGIRDPSEPTTLVEKLEAMDAEDAGLSPSTDDDYSQFSKRGRSA